MLFCTDFRFYFWIILYITKETVHGSNSEPDFSSDRWQGYLFHRFKPFIFNHLCIIVKTLKPLGKMCKGWPMDVCTLFRRTGRCTVRAYSNFGDLGGNIWQELMSVGLGYQSESLMAWFDDRDDIAVSGTGPSSCLGWICFNKNVLNCELDSLRPESLKGFS